MRDIYRILTTVFCVAFGVNAFSQITVTFTGRDSTNQYHIPLDHVTVFNLDQLWEEVLNYPDTILVLGTVGVGDHEQDSDIQLMQNVPNPFNGTTEFALLLPEDKDVLLEIYDITGRLAVGQRFSALSAGTHLFQATLSSPQTYLLSAKVDKGQMTIKMVNEGHGAGNTIRHIGKTNANGDFTLYLKEEKATGGYPFSEGDEMKYTGYAVIDEVMRESKTILREQHASEIIPLLFDLTVPTVNTDVPSSITDSTAFCGAHVTNNGGSEISAMGICWSTSPNPTIGDDTLMVFGANSVFNEWITSLIPNTTYHVRAFAMNGIGIAYGADETFTTLCNVVNLVITGNSTIDCGQSTTLTVSGADSYRWNTNATTASITVSPTAAITYTVTGTNSYGCTATETVTVTVNALVPTVTTNNVTNITATTATCGGSVTFDGCADVTARGVCWSTSANPTVSASCCTITNGNGIGSFTSSVTGLLPNTLYHVRAYAINSVDTAYGADSTFTTLCDTVIVTVAGTTTINYGQNTTITASGADSYVWSNGGTSAAINVSPVATATYTVTGTDTYGCTDTASVTVTVNPIAPSVRTDNISDVTSTSAICGGTVTDNGGAPVTGRGVCWGTSANPTVNGDHLSLNSGGNSFSGTVSGLIPNRTYHVRAYAINSADTAYGADRTFTTLCNTVEVSVPDNITINYGQSTTLTASGANSYRWNTNATTASITVSPTTTTTYTVTGTNSYGCTATANVTVTVNFLAPVVVTNDVSGITGTTATCGGNVTDDGGASVTTRGVCWSSTNTNPIASDSCTTNDGYGMGSFTSSIVGLTRGVTYYVRAYATNSAGTSYGETRTFTTLTTPIVTTAPVMNITGYSATCGGDVTSVGGTPVIARGVCWGVDSEPSTNGNHTNYTPETGGIGNFTSNITGLTPGTTYHVRAYATNSVGTAYGADSIFTTASLPIVITGKVNNVTAFTASSGGNVISDGGSSVIVRGICWSKEPNPEVSDTCTTTNQGGIGVFSSSITGLMPNTTYHVRAYATNIVNTAYGADSTFTTLCDTVNLVIAGNTTIDCGQSATLTASGANSYRWNTNATTASITVSPTSTTTYTVTGTNSYGCTATATVTLTVNPTAHIVDTETACESYYWHGMAYTESGTYAYDYTNTHGCPCTDTLHLTVYHPQHHSYAQTAYDTYTWTEGNGRTYNVSGTYLYSHTDANGCTQVDTLHLTVYYSSSNEFSATACESYVWDGQTYTSSGSYVRQYTDIHEADSVVTLHLTINHGTYNAETEEACDSYTWIDGNTYTESGTYTHYYINSDSCESVDTLKLTVYHSWTCDTTAVECDSFTWHGVEYTATPIVAPTHTYQTVHGCDSVVTLHLTISSLVFTVTVNPNQYCDNEANMVNGSLLPNPTTFTYRYERLVADGWETVVDNTHLPAGHYRVTATNSSGCTTPREYDIYDNTMPPVASDSSVNNTICDNGIDPFNGKVIITISNYVSTKNYTVILEDADTVSNASAVTEFTGLNAGTYTYKVIDNFYCEYAGEVEVEQQELPDLQLTQTPNTVSVPTHDHPANGTITVLPPYDDYESGNFEYAYYYAPIGGDPLDADNHSFTQTMSHLIDSLYFVTVLDLRTGCVVADTITVGFSPIDVVIDEKSCPAAPTVTDHEGNVYATVQIGNQCWMRDNLRTTTSPSTGTYLIPAAGTGYTYTGKQARWYNNDSATYASMNYGLLYNWNAAVDTFNMAYGETSVNTDYNNAVSVAFSAHRRGICPAGWHLPSDAEWTQLTNYVSSQSEYTCSGNSNNIAKALASTEGWNTSTNSCAVGNNQGSNNATGFSAVPAGLCTGSSFGDVGYGAYCWSSTQNDSSFAWGRYLLYYYADVLRCNYCKDDGRSVRCLRDAVIDEKSCPAAPTVTDHEGNVYATVQIGNQCWMRDNLRTTTSPSTGTYLIPAANANYTYTGKQARWYNNDSATYASMNYGLLYNWNAAVDTFNTAYGETSVNTSSSNAVSVTFSGHRRGICPAGWHLPSVAEWTQLTNYVSSQSEYTCSGSSSYIAKALASTEGWNSYSGECYPGDQSVTANNATGFSAVPAGACTCSGSSVDIAGDYANFWSATQTASYPSYAYGRDLCYGNADVGRYYSYKDNGRSVRCLRDETGTAVVDEKSCPAAPTVTDHEGNVYATVQIGNQCWMRDNLRTTTSPSTGTYLIPAAGTGYTYTGKQARWYDNDSATYALMNYGLLYNWNAAVDTFNTDYGELSVDQDYNHAASVNFSGHRRGICPAGWHLPSDAEWTQLTNYVSSQSEYTCSGNSSYIAKALASTEGWNTSMNSCAVGNAPSGNNATGFSAVPAGNCSGSSFSTAGNYAGFRSATQSASLPYYAYYRGLDYPNAGVYRHLNGKYYGRSVRCLRD